MKLENQQEGGVLKQLATEASAVFSGFENEGYKFQQQLINPKGENFFRFLNADMDLGNIQFKGQMLLNDWLNFGIELESWGLEEAAEPYFAMAESFIITSRSVDGFQQRQLNTNNSNVRQESINSEPKKSGFSFFRKK